MTSIVFYKFKNSISQESINFDGSIIQIGDVKRLIALKRGLGVEGAAELILSDPNTGDEYVDDTKAIPRNSLVLVKRTPVARLQPLQAGATTTAAPPPKATSLHHSTAPQNNIDEFGGDYFSEKPTAAVVGVEEDAALQNLLAGTAATWKREVRQGTVRGRGRGRGGRGGGGAAAATVPPDYRCPRCEEIGAHWLNDCPTQGNPEFDKRKIRPPVGIPMTRLARSQEGGLVLPDGGTGTLLANEDAFAREIMGMGGMGSSAGVITNGGGGGRYVEKKEEQEVLALPPAAAAPPPAAGEEDGHGGEMETGKDEMLMETEGRKDTGDLEYEEEAVAPAAATTVATAAEPPTTTIITTATSMDDRKFVEKYIQAPTLPRGPPEFITLAFNTDNPVDEEEFKEIQTKWRSRFKLPPLSLRAGVSGASGGGGGESAVTRSSRERSQSRSRHRHRSSRSPSASGGERKKRSGRSKSREGHGRRSKRSHKSRSRSRSRSKRHRHNSKDRSRSRSRSRRSKHRISRRSSRERSSKSRRRHVDDGEEEREKSVEIGEPSGGDVNGGKDGDSGGGGNDNGSAGNDNGSAGNDNKAAAPEDEVQLELDI
jgi:E3 ubiquitin-protein ligase RBBP6